MPVHDDERIIQPVKVALDLSPLEWESLIFWLTKKGFTPSRANVEDALAIVAKKAVFKYIEQCVSIYAKSYKAGPPK